MAKTLEQEIRTYNVVYQEWEESERGWGTRPDGYSLHKDDASRQAYIQEYWNSMPHEVPDEYSRPCGSPEVRAVDKKTYRAVMKEGSVRRWR